MDYFDPKEMATYESQIQKLDIDVRQISHTPQSNSANYNFEVHHQINLESINIPFY